MGTITLRKQRDGAVKYRAQIRIKKNGVIVYTESRTFIKQATAKAWMRDREIELELPGAIALQKHKGMTVGDVLKAYREDVGEHGNFGRSKMMMLKQLEGMMDYGELATLSATSLTAADLLAHVKRRRSQGAGAATVNNDLIWLRIAFKYVRRAKNIPLPLEAIEDAVESARAVRLIGRPKRRDRRPAPEELELLDKHFSQQSFRKDGTSPPMRLIMWLAIYTCRRQEELCGLLLADMDRESSSCMVRDMKHPDGSAGNNKVARMSEQAWQVVDAILRDFPSSDKKRLLPFDSKSVSASFTRACKLLGIEDLRFHDLRHEGCSRLAEDGATIPQIQQVSLHESWSSLQRYVNLSPIRLRRVEFRG